MLTRLSVSNFAIIDELQMQFQKGLTIITGETGAGKSILLGALKLILGERADLKQLGDESKKCIIEAHFDISGLNLNSFFEENELDFETETILRRELLPGGKSRAFVNDSPVTLTILQNLGGKLIDIHSQFNTENLFHTDFQLDILDAYAGHETLIKEYQSAYQFRIQKLNELKTQKEKWDNLDRETDYKKFLLDELQTAKLNPDEFQELEQEQKELQNTEEIQSILSEIQSKLDSPEFGILSQLHEMSQQLLKLASFGDSFADFQKRLESSRIELDDLQNEISGKLQGMEPNPHRLDEVSERLDLLHHLLHKHRVNSLIELTEIQSELENENQNFQELESNINELEKEIQLIEIQLDKKAKEISRNRKIQIPKIEKELLDSLGKLGMDNSSMQWELKERKEFGLFGKDDIEFLFSANKGSSLKPVSKSVSGGERSRLMLAVKKSLAGKKELPTLILDEIDTGVSGKVANEVGNLMNEMANDIQLISITHLPQVASKANQHFKISKKRSGDKTKSEVIELTDEQKIMEIAELISGSNITETAINQAKELINS